MDPNLITPPVSDWFEIVWGTVWALIMALGAAMWKTKAGRDEVSRTETDARNYTDNMVREAMRDFKESHRSDIQEINKQLAEIRGDIRHLLSIQSRGRRDND
jgi:hypothetical protein